MQCRLAFRLIEKPIAEDTILPPVDRALSEKSEGNVTAEERREIDTRLGLFSGAERDLVDVLVARKA